MQLARQFDGGILITNLTAQSQSTLIEGVTRLRASVRTNIQQAASTAAAVVGG